MPARANKGEGAEVLFPGSSVTPGAGSGALRRQHAAGALLVWHASRIARQQAVSVATPDWQACGRFRGRATIAVRRNRLSTDRLRTLSRFVDRLNTLNFLVTRYLTTSPARNKRHLVQYCSFKPPFPPSDSLVRAG